jgi:hypothetical protein
VDYGKRKVPASWNKTLQMPALRFLLGASLLSTGISTATHPVQNLPDQITATKAAGQTIAARFPAPAGWRRAPVAAGSFAEYLRNLPLRPEGAVVHYFDGRTKTRPVYAAVVNLDVGTRDLQQCADAVMRLRAEWLYRQGRKQEISFKLTDGFVAAYAQWMRGKRIHTNGRRTEWRAVAAPGDSYTSFRQYLDVVFTYAGTLSLDKSLLPQKTASLAIGDVFIRGGSPGHAVIVVDVIENAGGEKRFLLAQSYMPAQEIHILKNYGAPQLSPWYSARLEGRLETPEWDFLESELKTWPGD